MVPFNCINPEALEAMLENDEDLPTARPVASPQSAADTVPAELGGDQQKTQPIDLDEDIAETVVETPATANKGEDSQFWLDRQRTPPFTTPVSNQKDSKMYSPPIPEVAKASVVSEIGSVEHQPVLVPRPLGPTPHDSTPEPFSDVETIPDLADKTAPRFKAGEPQISAEAVRQRAKRIFMPRKDGSLKVSQEIFKEWKSKGKERKTLEEIFKRCGYSPDTGNELMCHMFWGMRWYSDTPISKKNKVNYHLNKWTHRS